jgi:hypothetical protein
MTAYAGFGRRGAVEMQHIGIICVWVSSTVVHNGLARDPARALTGGGDAVMKVWISSALVAAGLAIATPAVAGSTGVAPAKMEAARKSAATDLGARRVFRRYAYRPYAQPYYPTYYARPVAYRPYPYAVPAPFFLGFGYLPYW